MLRHVVMFRWADDVDEAHIAGLAAALDGLPATIPEIVVYRHGRDAGINAGNFDYAVVADFATSDDYLVYRDNPVHREVIARHVTGRFSERAAVQFVVDG